MGRLKKYFMAPGPDWQDLPIPDSPWHNGPLVEIPMEHYHLLMNLGASFNPMQAERFEELSCPESGRMQVSPKGLGEMIGFLKMIKEKVLASPPPVPEVTEEFLEDFTPDEHALMLDAIIAVFQVAQLSDEPILAGTD